MTVQNSLIIAIVFLSLALIVAQNKDCPPKEKSPSSTVEAESVFINPAEYLPDEKGKAVMYRPSMIKRQIEMTDGKFIYQHWQAYINKHGDPDIQLINEDRR